LVDWDHPFERQGAVYRDFNPVAWTSTQ